MTRMARDDSAHITVRLRTLGETLRQLREASGLSLHQAAELLGKERSGISKVETGTRPPAYGLLRDMINLYDVTDESVRQDLTVLYEQATIRGWWDATGLKAALKEIPWLERQAVVERVSSPSLIWGLLQVESYARVAIREVGLLGSDEQRIEAALKFRQARQDALRDRPDPPELKVVLGEGALRCDVGGPAVMVEQLEYLLQVTDRLPLTLQVMPHAAGLRGPLGQYTVIQMGRPYPEVAYAEGAGGITILEGAEAAQLAAGWQRQSDAALKPAESIDLIKAALEDWRQKGELTR